MRSQPHSLVPRLARLALVALAAGAMPPALLARQDAPAPSALPPAEPPAPSAPAQAEVTDISDLLESVRKAANAPSLVAAVVRGNPDGPARVVALGAAGTCRNGDPNRPVTTDSLFHIGSCTKAITATMIATLVDEGLLSFDLTIAQAMPDLAPPVLDDYKPVTLAQLLGHRGGINAFTDGRDSYYASLAQRLAGPERGQRADALSTFLSLAPVVKPGTEMRYSNAGYTVAAVFAERAADQSWEDLVRLRVFEPLGMTSARFGWPATPANPEQPWGHQPGSSMPLPPDHEYKLPAWLAPAGDISCSIKDFALFAGAHLQGIQGRPTPLKIAPATFARLHADVAGDQLGYAMGWGIGKDRSGRIVHAHDGSAGTFYSRMLLIPSADTAFVVATNTGNGVQAVSRATDLLIRQFAPAPATPAAPAPATPSDQPTKPEPD